ncbi:hypothetical protein [Thalassoroseus pseudoceratinae]|uniref:hypothetical protein n=1 Tax=Thalassoroseus pseudoceratinae TaxID=2713176 RepID=UPI0014209928|nr:hypothetical protein [Thalassoroseus pseudoceratinae]
MEHTRDRLSEPPTRGGVANDLQKLHRNGAASATELREFLSSIQGKSPQDALGAVAASGLVQALFLSTIGFVLVIGVFTVVPYLMSEPAEAASQQVESKAANTPAAPSKAPTNDATETAASPSEAPTNTAPTNPAASKPDLDNAARVLGIDETKGTDPADAPDLDSILDRSLE